MSTPRASVLISFHGRGDLLRRCLWAVAIRPPSVPFEVVLAGEEDVAPVAGEFSSCFPWQFIRGGQEEALPHCRGGLVYRMDDAVIVWADAFDRLRQDLRDNDLVSSSSYDLGQRWLDRLDVYGSNLTPWLVEQCRRFPLQSDHLSLWDTARAPGAPTAVSDAVTLRQSGPRPVVTQNGGMK